MSPAHADDEDQDWIEDQHQIEEKAPGEPHHTLQSVDGTKVSATADGRWRVSGSEPGGPTVSLWLERFTGSTLSAFEGGVDISDNGVQQLWLETPGGIEHLIVLADNADNSDSDEGAHERVLRLGCDGLTPINHGQDGVVFVDEQGQARFRYTNLAVWDASGVEQMAWFDVVGQVIEIHVFVEEGASWPLTIDPLASSVSKVIVGPDNSFFAGAAVASGDFDGDGYQDLAVGALQYGAGGQASESGRVFVYRGSASGLSKTTAIEIAPSPTWPGAACGQILAAADFGGDGRDDLAIGCPGRDLVYVYNGDANAVLIDANWSGFPPGTGSILAIETADLNGDGVIDLIGSGDSLVFWWEVYGPGDPAGEADIDATTAGIKRLDANQDGADDLAISDLGGVEIHFGISGPLANALGPVSATLGPATGSVGIADWNNDGADDVVLGVPAENKVYLYENQGDGTWLGWTFTDANSVALGKTVAGADLNYDGFDDLIFCDPGFGTTGRCRIYEGAPLGPELSASVATIFGPAGAADLKVRQWAASDFEADGAQDAVFGIRDNTMVDAQMHIYDGTRRTFDQRVYARLKDTSKYQHCGAAVAAGDLNGDGVDDVAVLCPGEAGIIKGNIRVYRGGAAMSQAATWDASLSTWDSSGRPRSIAIAKLRGHNQPSSLIVGEPDFDGGRGRVLIYDGYASDFPGQNPTYSIEGYERGANFGTSVANAKSFLNKFGDGLAVGAPDADDGGAAFFYPSLGSQGLDLTPIVVSGLSVGCSSSFGEFIASAGNVDEKNREDLLVGGSECSVSFPGEGSAFLYTSAAADGAFNMLWSYASGEKFAALGPVAGLGDLNGDGVDDFGLGVPLSDRKGIDAGMVLVFLGSNGGLPAPTPQTEAYGDMAGAQFGRSLAGGADGNRDGLLDVVVGAPGDSQAFTGAGNISLFGLEETSLKRYAVLFGTLPLSGAGVSVAWGEFDEVTTYGDVVFGESTYSGDWTEQGQALVWRASW